MRGAPAIAIVGCLSLALQLQQNNTLRASSASDVVQYVQRHMNAVVAARPTAVNIRNARDELNELLADAGDGVSIVDRLELSSKSSNEAMEYANCSVIKYCDDLFAADLQINKSIGDHGADAICQRADSQQRGAEREAFDVFNTKHFLQAKSTC